MPKVINAKNWDLTPAADGRRYSKYPAGDAPEPAVEVPAKIQNFITTSIAPAAVAFSWDTDPLATSYTLSRGLGTADGVDDGGGMTDVGTVSHPTNTITDEGPGGGFVEGQWYYWRVRGVNASGDGVGATRIFALPFTSTGGTDVPPYTLLVESGFEVDAFSDLLTPPDPSKLHIRSSGSTVDISTVVSRSGTRSMRSYLVQPSRRAEAQPWGTADDGQNIVLPWNKTFWFGVSIYIPSNWETNSKYGELIWQISHFPENENYKSPCVALYIDCPGRNGTPNQYSIVGRYINDQPAVNYPANTGLRTAFNNLAYSALDDRGKWTDWVVQYRPDYRALNNGGNGLVRIWKDGAQIIDYAGPNFYWSDTGVFVKWGCYKSDYANRADDVVTSRTYFYDNARVSRPDVGSYAFVDPSIAVTGD